jgi:AcrR family transcriptional regulator
MAEISRRAGVGMATLYRNFPGRRELLEACTPRRSTRSVWAGEDQQELLGRLAQWFGAAG